MNKITIKAYAKINLSLDIVGKKANGYHLVEMIMQQISLHDLVTLEKVETGIDLRADCDFVPSDHRNIAYRVAQALIEEYAISSGLRIRIEKNIPVAAGLAGGSTDAAAVIEGMNKLFNLGMDLEARQTFALKFGADIPFCLQGGTAVARGIGEDLEVIKGLEDTWLLLAKPNIGVSTETVYKAFDLNRVNKHPNTPKLIEALAEGQIKVLADQMYNVLEEVTGKMHKEIGQIEKKMRSFGALNAMMSGSGPTVFGLYKNHKAAKDAYNNMSKNMREVFLVQACQGGNKCE